MKRYLIYACENIYQGLYGIEDYCIERFSDDFTEDKIYSEYVPEMSIDLMYSYNNIIPEDMSEEELDEFIQENISGYVRQISEDFDEIPTAQLDDILFELGVKEFERIYCVHLPNL